jgi:plasmid maintenance system antidote protein VapI
MTEISGYFDAVKDRYHLSSDYTLAKKLGIAQPEANLMRRGLKIPKPELCIKIAKLLEKNPRMKVQEYMNLENRFRMLSKSHPDHAREFFK